jgi:hypothetical protein
VVRILKSYVASILLRSSIFLVTENIDACCYFLSIVKVKCARKCSEIPTESRFLLKFVEFFLEKLKAVLN